MHGIDGIDTELTKKNRCIVKSLKNIFDRSKFSNLLLQFLLFSTANFFACFRDHSEQSNATDFRDG